MSSKTTSVSSTAGAYVKLSAPLAEDLTALEKRSGSLRKHGDTSLKLAALFFGIAVAAYAVGQTVEPRTVLASVHIPPEVLAAFSDVVDSGTGRTPLSSQIFKMNGLLSALTEFMSLAGAVVGALVFMAGGWKVLKGEDGIGIMAGAIVFGAMSAIVPSLLGGIESPSTQAGRSPSGEFVQLAKTANVDELKKSLQAKVPESLQQYVVTQAMLKGTGFTPASKVIFDNGVLKVDAALASGEVKAVLSGETLYALEKAAFGSAKSKLAQDYFAETSSNAALANKISELSAGIFALQLMIGLSLMFMGIRMRNRVSRIRSMLGSSDKSISEVKAIAKDASDKPHDVEHWRKWHSNGFPLFPGASRRDVDLPSRPQATPVDDGFGVGRAAAVVVGGVSYAGFSGGDDSCRKETTRQDAPDVDGSCAPDAGAGSGTDSGSNGGEY